MISNMFLISLEKNHAKKFRNESMLNNIVEDMKIDRIFIPHLYLKHTF